MFALVINETNQKFSVIPFTQAEEGLPKYWEIGDWNESKKWLLQQKFSPLCTWKDFDEVSADTFKPKAVKLKKGLIEISRTKSKKPAAWESGGGMGSRGNANIICNATGGRKVPIFTRTRGSLANANHVLFVLNKGDHIISIRNKDGDGEIHKVVGIERKNESTYAITEIVAAVKQNAWWPELPEHLKDAYSAAVKKANIYHCKSAVYMKARSK